MSYRTSLPFTTNHLSAGTVSDWRDEAVCRDKNTELFFATGTSGPALLQVKRAKAVCRRCPVKDDCLQYALKTGIDYGVWGGMSEKERRAYKRKQQSLPKTSGGRTCVDCPKAFRSSNARQVRCQACIDRTKPLPAPQWLLGRADDIIAWKRAGLKNPTIAQKLGCGLSTLKRACAELGIGADGTVREPAKAAA